MMESTRNLHIVLFIGVMCAVQTLAQVCPYIHPNCFCSPTSVSCDILQIIPPLNTGANVIPVTELTFQRGNITSISKNSLPPGLTSITLLRHPLTNISEDAFDTSAATLQTVYFFQVNFHSLPTALNKLTKLTSLTIENTVIQDWDTAILKQIAATLVSLTLKNVSLSAWPNWISEFHLLRNVDLSVNALFSIPDDAFSSIKDSLTSLHLSNTGITHVPQALSTLSSLNILYLSNNNFTDVSEIEKITGFPFAQKLFYLSLDSVGLSRIANLSILTGHLEISLSGNRLSDIPAGLLPASLTTLSIYNNFLPSVPKAIATLSRLSTLFIDNNLITDIEPNSFPSSLSFLGMSDNNLTIITNTTFRNLNLLQNLNLQNNPITTISPEAFSDLVSLRYLYITNSRLIEIPLAFARLNSNVYIYFSTTQKLACPCPVFHELVQWFTSLPDITYRRNIDVKCSNGQSIDSYLGGQCDHS